MGRCKEALGGCDSCQEVWQPIDPNPAISGHAVFPQSGHIRPEKLQFFQKKSTFSRNRTKSINR